MKNYSLADWISVICGIVAVISLLVLVFYGLTGAWIMAVVYPGVAFSAAYKIVCIISGMALIFSAFVGFYTMISEV